MKFIVLPPFKRISQCIEYLIEERLFYLTSAKATDKIKARCKEGVCDALLREWAKVVQRAITVSASPHQHTRTRVHIRPPISAGSTLRMRNGRRGRKPGGKESVSESDFLVLNWERGFQRVLPSLKNFWVFFFKGFFPSQNPQLPVFETQIDVFTSSACLLFCKNCQVCYPLFVAVVIILSLKPRNEKHIVLMFGWLVGFHFYFFDSLISVGKQCPDKRDKQEPHTWRPEKHPGFKHPFSSAGPAAAGPGAVCSACPRRVGWCK